MLITFKEMQRRVGARLQNTDTTITNANDILPKIKDWINDRYQRLIQSYPWPGIVDDYDLTIVASTRAYALPKYIGKIWAIFDKTNGWSISAKTVPDHVRHHAIDLDQTGNVQQSDPRRYYVTGIHTVKAEIGSAAEKISVVSSSASDITPQVVHVKGLVSGSCLEEDIVLTGTVAADSANTYAASQKLTINLGTSDGTRPGCVGTITVSGKTSSTEFAVISGPYEQAAQYKWIEVSPLPKASGTQPTWQIWYSRSDQMLIDNNDVPIIDICPVLIQGAYADGLYEDGQTQEAMMADQKFAAMAGEAFAAQEDPNRIGQFTPQSQDLVETLDYGRIVGGNE
jgi:hypothetical protein